MDPGSMEAHKDDPEVISFLANAQVKALLSSVKKLTDVKDMKFDGLVYPGGHGPMFDLATDELSHAICRKIWEQGAPVAALCHGPAAIANVKLTDGSYLINKRKVTGFSNKEEDAAHLSAVMPFMLETQMIKNGGLYEKAAEWKPKVVIDGKLITGQNPASAHPLAEAFHKVLA